MKKKFLSSLLFAALVGGAVSTFTACKDYDDDINNLQKQIDDQAKLLKELQEKINSGCVITNVEPITGGTRVTLSDGNHFDVLNGANGEPGVAGKNGTVWTIGSDGYWYKDEGNGAVKTDYKALGTDADKWTIGDDGYWYLNGDKTNHKATGADGDKWTIGSDGYWYLNGDKTEHKATGADGSGSAGKDGQTIYYKPNGEGYFDKCHLDENGNEVVDQKNAVEVAVKGAISASIDSEYLIFTGVTSAENGTVKISLTSDLRSLVFMPKLYLDGIETVKYPWIQTKTNLELRPSGTAKNNHGKSVKGLEDWASGSKESTCNYGPAWEVAYHMNPSNSNVKSADVLGFNMLESEVMYTRAAGYKVNYAPELFKAEDGILTVGMQVNEPQNLVSIPTKEKYQKDQVIALRVNTKASVSEGVVTSDYALIRPMKTTVEGLVWAKAPNYSAAAEQQTGDEECAWAGNAKVHVWDTPKEAVEDVRGAALDLYWKDAEGITISDFLGIHYSQENVNPNVEEKTTGTWKFGAEAKYGLSYEFKLIDYIVGTEETRDSRFGVWVNQAKGQLRAWNVALDGKNVPDGVAESVATVGREPLVQVVVKDHCDNVILDGYIRVVITDKPVVDPDKENKEITKWPKETTMFDLCNDSVAYETTWAEFNQYVLTQEMNMAKEVFDAQYEIDYESIFSYDADNNPVYKLKTFSDTKGTAIDEFKIGLVTYLNTGSGTTNHLFKWEVMADILEAWTHDVKLPVEKSVYVRYKAVSPKAEYPYIYIKFTSDFIRKPIGSVKFAEKINEYWYAIDGNDNGFDAIVLDVNEPRDYSNIKNIEHEINKTMVRNAPIAAGKYYFAPEEYTIETQELDANGKKIKYIVTPQVNSNSNEYKTLYCKYITLPMPDTHPFPLKSNGTVDVDALNDLLNKCAISYGTPGHNGGAFANKSLYAHKPGSTNYIKIADLNQADGVITLVKNDVTKAILNAVGYVKDHKNINTEMRARIGFISANECGVACKVEDNLFTASWQRPINIQKMNHIAVDAKTNGNYIYILDFLKLYDWRGYDFENNSGVGYMWGDQQWFWAYYGVKNILIDLDPAKVTTNMHGGDLKTTTLESVSKKVKLVNMKSMLADDASALSPDFDLSNWHGDNYNMASMSAALVADMMAHKSEFGGIYYENNGENVTQFTVRVPVKVVYEWGNITEYIDIEIERTAGN